MDFSSKTITEIIDLLIEINFDHNVLLNMLDGEDREIIHRSGHFKIVIRNIWSKINTVVIDGELNQMTSVFFNGQLNIPFSDIRALIKVPSEAYSTRDEIYFYSFDMKRDRYNFSISFYDSSQIDISKEGWLPNLGVAIGNEK